MRVLSGLQLVWTHPFVYEAEEERNALKAEAEADCANADVQGGEYDASEAIAVLDTSDDVRG